MVMIHFVDPPSRVDVSPGTSVLRAARRVGAPVGSSCGGACACSGCHVVIEEGAHSLSQMDDDEEVILSTSFASGPMSRLACQAIVRGAGSIRVRITNETRIAYEEHHARAG